MVEGVVTCSPEGNVQSSGTFQNVNHPEKLQGNCMCPVVPVIVRGPYMNCPQALMVLERALAVMQEHFRTMLLHTWCVRPDDHSHSVG